MTKVAVIYYPATGNVHALAEAVADGAAASGAQVRPLRVAELAPAGAIEANPAWRAHADATLDIDIATLDDVRWADALAFGNPARFGNVGAPLKHFLESTGPLWFRRVGEQGRDGLHEREQRSRRPRIDVDFPL